MGFANIQIALGGGEPTLTSILFAIADARANPLYSVAMRSFDGGDTWEDVPAFPTAILGFNCLAYSDTLDCLVATSTVLDNSNIVVSFDRGVTWQSINKGNNASLIRVVWVPWIATFIAPQDFLSGATYVWTSTDGLNWTRVAISPNDFLDQTFRMMQPIPERSLVYGNIGNRDTNSPNGLTLWAPPRFTVGSLRSDPSSYTYHNYSPTLDRFVMAGTSDGNFWYSDMTTNAINTGVLAGAGSANQPVVWSPTLSYYLSTGNNVNKTSVNGIAWTSQAEPVNTVAYFSTIWSTVFERFVSVGRVLAVGKTSHSQSGLLGTWTTVFAVSDANWCYIIECLVYE